LSFEYRSPTSSGACPIEWRSKSLVYRRVVSVTFHCRYWMLVPPGVSKAHRR
jgi:hypothetical protein